VSLPGADELFRTTGGMALQSSTPRQHSGAEPAAQVAQRPRPAPAGTPDPGTAREPAADDGSGAPADAGQGTDAPAARAEYQPAPGVPAPGAPTAEHARSGPEPQGPPAQRRAPQEPAEAPRRQRRVAPNRRPSGRERHDEKITVYVSAEELMDLEHARLVLRGEHGLAVDRGRIVREAVAVVLADLESRGDASILVRRLRGR
jgi:hypothetical protein